MIAPATSARIMPPLAPPGALGIDTHIAVNGELSRGRYRDAAARGVKAGMPEGGFRKGAPSNYAVCFRMATSNT